MPSDVYSNDGTLLHCEECGNPDGPTVLMTHCWAGTCAFWQPVVEQLSPALRVVRYDQRGHGQSQVPATRSGYSVEKLADDFCSVLQAHVDEGQKALVVGHSMGGITVMSAAARPEFKERVGGIVLTNTGCSQLLAQATALPIPGPLGRWLKGKFITSPLLGNNTDSKVFQFILKHLMMGKQVTDAQVQACARKLNGCTTEVRVNWGKALIHAELDDRVRQIAVKTLVIAGSDDKLMPPWHARHIGEVIPNQMCKVIEVPGQGHMGPIEGPDFLAEQINAMAREVFGELPQGNAQPQ